MPGLIVHGPNLKLQSKQSWKKSLCFQKHTQKNTPSFPQAHSVIRFDYVKGIKQKFDCIMASLSLV